MLVCTVQAFKACGTNLPLRFPNNGSDPPELPGKEWVDFEKEEGKVIIVDMSDCL